MTARTHLSLLVMSFITWFVFVLIGLPDYYQSWAFPLQLALLPLVTLLYFPGTKFILNKFPTKEHFRNSLWLALYLTLPLFTYDYIYIVLMKGDNMTFVFRYWYLSFFYVSFWIQMPLIGWWMEKNNKTLA